MGVLTYVSITVIALSALAYAYYTGAKAGMRSMRPAQDHLLDRLREEQERHREFVEQVGLRVGKLLARIAELTDDPHEP